MLLTLYLEQWQWQGRASWELALSAVDYGAVLYAMLAVLVEKGGNLMFWAWEKHKERQEKLRAEGRAEVKKQYEERLARVAAEVREKGITLESLREQPSQQAAAQSELLAEMQAKARVDNRPEIAAWLEEVARERDMGNGVSQQR